MTYAAMATSWASTILCSPFSNRWRTPLMTRFPHLTREQMTDAQKRVYDGIVSGPRGGARGPFNALLRSPDLADRVQKVGEYLRFNTSLPARLNELAILVNAR